MTTRRSPGAPARATSTTPIIDAHQFTPKDRHEPLTAEDRADMAVASRQVSWWDTHTFISGLTANLKLPLAGTPAWCALSDDEPRKLLALALAGEHHVLRVEVAQEALAEASRDVAAAADWPQVSREIHRRNSFYAERPWLKRAVVS